MRIYIIGNDGITLCDKAPATVNDGEIAVASNKELHAAPVNVLDTTLTVMVPREVMVAAGSDALCLRR